jgi:DNA-binding transcriptional ArsR family regulator
MSRSPEVKNQIRTQKVSINKIKNSCSEVCLILKALSHPQRLLILGHLLNGSKSVGELVDCTELSQSQMSQFLTRMKMEGLIASERQGKFQVYSIIDKRLMRLMQTLQDEYGSDKC